jgi:glycosyltransferase involved in cell wall biosynthesis
MTSATSVAGNNDSHEPLFTILLPTHARSDVIGFAIQSVLAQYFQSFELMVIGDGAEPGTKDAVMAFGDPRIQWLDLPKSPGFGYANRNVALRIARGKYVAFVADDDLLLPDHLSLLKEQLDTGAKLACVRAAWVSSDGIAAPFPNNLSLPDELEAFMTRSNSMPASCFAYRKDALDDNSHWPEDGQGAGDWRLWHRMLTENPTRPIGVISSYSVLHFAARRRASRFSDMPELAYLLQIADHSDWWPKVLRADIADGQIEQAVYHAILVAPNGPARLRAALQIVSDRLAWEAIQSSIPDQRRLVVQTPVAKSVATEVPEDFDPLQYLLLNPDVALAGMDANDHWLRYGQFELRPYRKSAPAAS